ncbi:hypothetical protein A3A35_02285 [Candidatus Kaiserbacteria bacterium RIFCSPLOWO2_01_FULL_51_21]|uniref:Transposase IS200-like domain-containing protein n=1 Tax=Candidatus Kaiserbacteria bacterium RIFCSPLOWO2_01_FULL_51_21 TaxID=1798508 RepID=A0A1F6ECM3_9BACT|nr:MAG: hypothetical protein A3A35_02285 [Candidatus Kaiserbacteria bacterium RIFCSPLOWO2_01_FULL_51_21]
MRKTVFANGEFYHIYNRGTDKRTIFLDEDDVGRFFQSMEEFNTLEPIGSIYERSFLQNPKTPQLRGLASKLRRKTKLVNFICYCVHSNHYHFLLEQIVERGIEKFLHRLGTGYTMYFNTKYKRSGSLFQGSFKSIHINSDEYLLYVSAYINLNTQVHQLGGLASKLVGSRSSWEEYQKDEKGGFCKKEIILGQFENTKEYEEFARSSLTEILERRRKEKEIDSLLLE